MMYPERELPDGRTLVAMPLTFGRGRVGVCQPGDKMSFYDVW
jgi:hypothetical protein